MRLAVRIGAMHRYTGDIAEKNAAMLNGIGARQLAAMMRSWFGRDTS
jgi:hypothetical protein